MTNCALLILNKYMEVVGGCGWGRGGAPNMDVLSAVFLIFLQPAWHSSCRKCRLSPGTLSEMRRATATPQVGWRSVVLQNHQTERQWRHWTLRRGAESCNACLAVGSFCYGNGTRHTQGTAAILRYTCTNTHSTPALERRLVVKDTHRPLYHREKGLVEPQGRKISSHWGSNPGPSTP